MNTVKLDKLLSFLDLPTPPTIGVDISSSAIKCVELSRSRAGTLTVENFSIEPTPKESLNHQGIANADALGAALARGWKKLGSKIKRIAIAIPSNIAITKKVKMANNLDDIAMAEEVQHEAKGFSPFPLDEVFLDWVILGPHPNSPETDNEVLICCARQDKIQEYMAMAEAAGLQVGTVDIDTFAQQRAFESIHDHSPDRHDQVIAVADAGVSSLHISFYNRGAELVFSKEVAFGSAQLIESIARTYEVSFDEAEEFKRAGGQGLIDYDTKVLGPFLDNLGMEINRALQFFLTQATVEKIDSILLAGACASLSGAAEAVGRNAQISTEACNPFSHMAPSSRAKGKNLDKEAPALMTACGLALRRFDN
jgi:type IV pilus assembly protein PilM